MVHRNYSKDGTRKWVFRVGDGEGSLVETVLIPAEDKQVHVKPCVFHHKWVVHWIVHSVRRVSKVSNVINPAEIIGQFWMANYSYMEDVPVAERERTVTNVVMMGMGEPLLNYDAVLSSMQLMLMILLMECLNAV